MATGRKAPLVEWKRYRVLLLRVDEQKGFPKKVDWPTHLNSPPSAGFYVYETEAAMHTQYRSNYMHEDQAAMVKMGIGAGGQLLWLTLNEWVAMATLFCCFADWASAAEVLAPGAGMVDRTGCAMNPGTKIVGGVAALVASGALALVSRSFRTSWGDGKGAAERSLRRQACRRPANRLQGHHEAYKPGSCGCWRLLVAGTLCRG